jgi:hypothetical protein
MENLIAFFGWCSVLNILLLSISAFFVFFLKSYISKIHSILFDISRDDIYKSYFQYLAFYKILIIVFNIIPYIALKIIV